MLIIDFDFLGRTNGNVSILVLFSTISAIIVFDIVMPPVVLVIDRDHQNSLIKPYLQ
jgi:hypothetical protein